MLSMIKMKIRKTKKAIYTLRLKNGTSNSDAQSFTFGALKSVHQKIKTINNFKANEIEIYYLKLFDITAAHMKCEHNHFFVV